MLTSLNAQVLSGKRVAFIRTFMYQRNNILTE